MANIGKQDQIIDLLQQIQLRKSIKAEDATRALRQYYRVLEQIKQLKDDIEQLKNSNKLQQLSEPVKETPVILEDNKRQSRKSSITSVNSVSTTSPAIRRKSVNSTSPRRSIASIPSTRDTSFADDRSNMRPLDEPMTNGVVTGAAMAEKDKEIARLRLQNAQLKVLIERRVSSTLNGDKTGEIPKPTSGPESLSIKFPSQTELVGEFKKIYEKEWRSTFHDVEKNYKIPEEQITEMLATIAKNAYNFCVEAAKQQLEDISRTHTYVTDIISQPKYTGSTRDVHMAKSKTIIDKEGHRITRKFLKEYRKALATVSIPGVMELFELHLHRDVLPKLTTIRVNPKTVRPYVHRLIEIVWLMCVLDPPIVQVWQRPGQLMNREQFVSYSKKGATIIILHTVWPALIVKPKDGELQIEKGVCLIK